MDQVSLGKALLFRSLTVLLPACLTFPQQPHCNHLSHLQHLGGEAICTLQSRVALTTSAAIWLPLLPHIHPAHAAAETAQVSISVLKLIKGWKRRSWCQYLLHEARGSRTWGRHVAQLLLMYGTKPLPGPL